MTRILVAEDERRIRELLVDTLCDAGYDVIEAEDGGEALAKVGQEHPDLVLLDVMMPVLDGFQLLEQLKNDPITQASPVIMATDNGQEGDQLKARSIGAWDYITKPWESSDEVIPKVMNAEIATQKVY